MGALKNLLIASEEDSLGNSIADALGLSYFELAELDYELHTNESEDGLGLIYNYYVEFSPNSPRRILDKIDRLEGLTVTLNVSEIDNSTEEYYDNQYDAIISEKNIYDIFIDEISNLRKLNDLEIEDEYLNIILKRQIYIGIIGTMEAFLSETFIKLTTENENYLKRFVKTHPDFRKQKFELRDIFDSIEKITETAKRVMLDTIYHDLPKVKEMYRSTFEIEFPKLQNVIKSVLTRHDLVHRNGKTKEGKQVELSKESVEELIVNIVNFVEDIEDKLNMISFEDKFDLPF